MKIKNNQKFVLSDAAILFIKKYIVKELNISAPVDEDMLSEIEHKAVEWECAMVDSSGYDIEGDYSGKERNQMADEFVSELSWHWSRDEEPDYVDLNSRLGFN